MLEFITVDHPSFMPNACACCGSAKGPVADTHRELPMYGRVYVCRLCVTRLARVFGVAKGKKMDELIHAAEQVETAQAEVDRHVATETELREELLAARMRISVLEDHNEALTGRVDQLRDAIRQEAKDKLALVDG